MKSVIFIYFCVLVACETGSVVIRNLPDYCREDGSYYICEGLNFGMFEEVEFDISKKFDTENFQYINSDFSTIPRNAFRISKPVNYFYMQSCNLKEIHKWNFYSGHSNVKTSTLFLDYNRIEKLPSGVFEYLPNLMTLRLTENKLSILEINCFQGLKNLVELWLQNNHIQALREDTFNDLTNLESIDLSENHLQSLPANVFQNNRKLEIIDLQDNYLKIIDINVVRSSAALQFMSTHFDKSVQITPISIFSLPSATSVDVSRNYFPYISSKSLSKMIKLVYFRAIGVNLTYIEDGAFSHMPTLRLLHLENNLLETFDLNLVSNLRHLKQLYIHNNRLKTIDYQLLLNSPNLNLTRIGLENNLLSCDHHRDLNLFLKEIKIESDLIEQKCIDRLSTMQDEEFTYTTTQYVEEFGTVQDQEYTYTTTQTETSSNLPEVPSKTSLSTTPPAPETNKCACPIQRQVDSNTNTILTLTILILTILIAIAVLIILCGLSYAFCSFFKRRSYADRIHEESEIAVRLVETKS